MVFWFGDLNFRIDDLDMQVVKSAIDNNKYTLLWEKDQVRKIDFWLFQYVVPSNTCLSQQLIVSVQLSLNLDVCFLKNRLHTKINCNFSS